MATSTVEETIEHLDFDEATPCEWMDMFGEVNCPFDAEAEWAITTSKNCCEKGTGLKTTLVCSDCMERRMHTRVRCIHCWEAFFPGATIVVNLVRL